MPLNELESLVITTKVMQLTQKEALAYLAAHNRPIGKSTYYRILGKIESETTKKLYEIGRNLKQRHMERIQELATIKKELWLNYHKLTDPFKKSRVLVMICDMQSLVSAYDEASQYIVEGDIKRYGKEGDVDLSHLGV